MFPLNWNSTILKNEATFYSEIDVDRNKQQIAASSVTRKFDEEKLRTENEIDLFALLFFADGLSWFKLHRVRTRLC